MVFFCSSVHCEMSEWGEWSACFQQCAPNGDPSLTDRCRFRHINQKPEGGGVECGEIKEHSECPLCDKEGNEMPKNESKLSRPNYYEDKIDGGKLARPNYGEKPNKIYGSKPPKGYEQQPNEMYGSKQPKGYEPPKHCIKQCPGITKRLM